MLEPKKIVEAILFSSSEPLTTSKLGDVLDGVDGRGVRLAIKALNEEYEQGGAPFALKR